MNRITDYISGTNTSLRGDTIRPDLTLADVRRELFDWQAVEADLTSTLLAEDGVRSVPVGTHKAILRDDDATLLGVVGVGYKVHQYGEWLADNVAAMLDTDDLVIRSAGLLNNGSRAFVQVGTPEGITGPGGVEYLPIIGSYTSLDSSVATTYKGNRIVVVCENTYAGALREKAERVAIRHTRNSTFNVLSAREALGMVFANADAFNAELEELLNIRVSDGRFEKVIAAKVAPSTDTQRSLSIAERKGDELRTLWRTDVRVAPWKGTAWGALQALNTWRTHIQTVKGATRSERNMAQVMLGTSDAHDRSDLDLILETVGA